MAQRAECLVATGWFFAFALYIVQGCILMKFLEDHTTTHSNLYWIGVGIYLAYFVVVLVVVCRSRGYAETDDEMWWVWCLWLVYILIFMISVAIIFGEIVDELDTSDTYGPNFLKAMMCITPALLVLILQLVISPSYRSHILSVSVFAALNLFDGIEMLEIVLMQNERDDLQLDDPVKKAIIAFACLSFLVTSLGLTLNKFNNGNNVERRTNDLAVCLGFCEILFTNVPFLVLRIYVWADCGYEASIFIAKNIVSLVVGLVEFCIACKCCTCE